MKVYVVQHWTYDSNRLLGVATSPEKAKRFGVHPAIEVIEVELDELPEGHPEGMLIYNVVVSTSGRPSVGNPLFPDEDTWEFNQHYEYHGSAQVWAKDEEEATAIAMGQYEKFLQNGGWKKPKPERHRVVKALVKHPDGTINVQEVDVWSGEKDE